MPKILNKFIKLVLAVLLAIVSCFVVNTLPVSAVTYKNVNNFYFKDFTADYFLSRDEEGVSHLLVIERLTIQFPNYDQNHGFTRVIPFTNNGGKNLTMVNDRDLYINVEHNGVDDASARYEVGDGYFLLYVGNEDTYVHGEQKYTLTYEFQNVILPFEEDGMNWQELFWDTNGVDSMQRFQNVTARLHFEDDLQDAFDGRIACYVGKYGETNSDRCNVSDHGEYIEFNATNLTSRENLSFAVGFDANTFANPPERYNYTAITILIIEILVSSIPIILMILALSSTKENRNYYKSLFTKPEYTPPQGFTVAEMMENYIGKGKRGNPKVATLLELATSHKIELVKSEAKGAFGRKKENWKVRILHVDQLTKEQEIVLQLLAGSKSPLRDAQEITIKTHSSNSELVELSGSFQQEIKKSLTSKQLLAEQSKNSKQPNYTSILTAVAAIWLLGLIFVFIIFANGLFDPPSYLINPGGIAPAIIIIIYAVAIEIASSFITTKTSPYTNITQKGLDYSKYLEGLQLYIKMAETDRIKFLQSVKGADTSHAGVVKLYEKLLPYASAFGLEKTWLEEMGKYYEFEDVTAPNWYFATGVFSASEFSRALNSISTTAGHSIAHSTTSNSSSIGSSFSSGGGGFSGGGGGGGGFGGW